MHLVKALNLLTITNRLLNVPGASPFAIHSNNSYKTRYFWVILIQYFSKLIRSNAFGYSHSSWRSHPLIKVRAAVGSGLNASEMCLVNFAIFFSFKTILAIPSNKKDLYVSVKWVVALHCIREVPEFEPWLGDQICWHVPCGVLEFLQHAPFCYHKLEHGHFSFLGYFFSPIILLLDGEC